MPLQELGSSTGTPTEMLDLTKMPYSFNDVEVVENEVSGSKNINMTLKSHPGIPLMSDSTTQSRVDPVERSISREPGSVLERAIQSLEDKGKEIYSKETKDLLGKAKDSIEVSKNSPKLKRSRSEAIGYSRRDTEIERCKDGRSSRRDSRRSKSNALVTKRKSKFMLISEKLGQSSLPSLGAHKRAVEGKVFGFLFFTGNTGRAADAKVKKDGKKDVKDKKDGKKDVKDKKDKKNTNHRTSNKNTKEDNKRSGKKTEEKRTRQHGKQKKYKKSAGDRQNKVDRSHAKKSEIQDRKISEGAGSKNMETLCKFEISPDKKDSGLVVKVCRKRS